MLVDASGWVEVVSPRNRPEGGFHEYIITTLGKHSQVGVSYSKRRIHGKKYFHEILDRVEEIPPSVRTNTLIRDRVQRLMTIPGVGEITALTWVLEIGEPERFTSIRQTVSYCGLCSAQRESAGKER